VRRHVRGVGLGILLVGVLALVWAALLLPSMFRARLESSPIDGVRSFERSMGILASARNRKGQTPGRWIMVPRSDVTAPVGRRGRILRRRRQNFERLVAAAAVTLIAGFIPHLHWLWFVHLAFDGALGIYVSRLLRYKREELERREKVETIPSALEEPTQQSVSSL
jgi:hypothetical protein